MILDAMEAISAEGVSICDAHPDLEVFRSVMPYTYAGFIFMWSFDVVQFAFMQVTPRQSPEF